MTTNSNPSILLVDDQGLVRAGMRALIQISEPRADIQEAGSYDEAMTFSEGMAAVKLDGKWGFIDSTGNVAIPLKYADAMSFHDSIAIGSLFGDKILRIWVEFG